MKDPEEFLDIKQAARLLKVSEISLRRWTNSGRVACVRVGRRRERRFRRADLLAFLEEQPATGGLGPARPHRAEDGQMVIAGIPLTHGSHLCALYSSDSDRVRQAVDFLADGLRPGNVCYLVAEPEARDPILARFEERHPSLQGEIDAGRLVLSEYAPTVDAQLGYWEDQFVAATRAGARSLRVVGNVTGGGLANGGTVDGAVAYEEGYDRRLARRFPVVTLCQYDVRRLAGPEVLKVLKCHKDSFRYPAERVLG